MCPFIEIASVLRTSNKLQEQSVSREANRCSDDQWIPRISWYLDVHYHVHENRSWVQLHILSLTGVSSHNCMLIQYSELLMTLPALSLPLQYKPRIKSLKHVTVLPVFGIYASQHSNGYNQIRFLVYNYVLMKYSIKFTVFAVSCCVFMNCSGCDICWITLVTRRKFYRFIKT